MTTVLITKVIKKITGLLESIGLGLVGSALFLFVTGTVGDVAALTALVVGFVVYVVGATLDVVNDMSDGP